MALHIGHGLRNFAWNRTRKIASPGGLLPFHANGLYERLNELRRQITESRPKWPAIRVLLLPGALHNSTRVAKPVKRFRISGAATDLLGEKESSKEPESFVPQLTNS